MFADAMRMYLMLTSVSLCGWLPTSFDRKGYPQSWGSRRVECSRRWTTARARKACRNCGCKNLWQFWRTMWRESREPLCPRLGGWWEAVPRVWESPAKSEIQTGAVHWELSPRQLYEGWHVWYCPMVKSSLRLYIEHVEVFHRGFALNMSITYTHRDLA